MEPAGPGVLAPTPTAPDSALPTPSVQVPRLAHRGGTVRAGTRAVAEETPVALSYNNATHAVMMATPADLEDFALGFSLSEGIVAAAEDIETIDIVPLAQGRLFQGIDARIWLRAPAAGALLARRRHLLGASGCGMCGMESLAEANRALPRVPRGRTWRAADIAAAVAALAPAQRLNADTHAVHAAAFWQVDAGLLLREDVGRHNALDKLIGALSRAGRVAEAGILVLSSRLSVELVQKAAMLGAPVVVSVSAPTALAIRAAEQAGITLVAVARADGFEVFCGAHRIEG
jgi:FdhD protein